MGSDEDDDEDTLNGEEGLGNGAENGLHDGWCSLEEEEEEDERGDGVNPCKRAANPPNRVRFREAEERDAMDFSPPRMPRNSPSYLIWSIFTREREERAKKRANKTNNNRETNDTNGRPDSPLSLAPMASSSDMDFGQTLLNAKLAELERHAERLRTESASLQASKRRLTTEKKKLAEEKEAFEKTKEAEQKKLEEERRRAKRDKVMLERLQRERAKSGAAEAKTAEVEELQSKVKKALQNSFQPVDDSSFLAFNMRTFHSMLFFTQISSLQEDLERRDTKWATTVSKLQDQVKYLERENQHLHEENHKLKLRGAAPKVAPKLNKPRKRIMTFFSDINSY
jgi:hypothetical protein